MRTFYFIISILSCQICSAQHLPVSAYTYDSCTAIDNYFGETDSLLLKYKVQTVKVFFKKDTMRLLQVETFRNGRKTKREEYHPSGKPERTIKYSYQPNIVSAELIHYPSPDDEDRLPSGRFEYLVAYLDNDQPGLAFKRDSMTGIVRLYIRHTWQKVGTIRFEAFDLDKKLVATHTLRPLMSLEDYRQFTQKTNTNQKIVTDEEEYTYNGKGKLIHYKSVMTRREDHYTYDDRGLLVSIERLLRGKPDGTLIYTYN